MATLKEHRRAQAVNLNPNYTRPSDQGGDCTKSLKGFDLRETFVALVVFLHDTVDIFAAFVAKRTPCRRLSFVLDGFCDVVHCVVFFKVYSQ